MDTTEPTQVEQSSEVSSWLEFLNERIEEERDELFSESPSYEIVRDLLVASEDDDTAISQAVTKFYDLYRAEADKRVKWEDHGAGEYLNTIAIIVFDVAPNLWYTSWRHQRIAEFLIAIKNGAAAKYHEEVGNIACHCLKFLIVCSRILDLSGLAGALKLQLVSVGMLVTVSYKPRLDDHLST